jgi:hypothetical protein
VPVPPRAAGPGPALARPRSRFDSGHSDPAFTRATPFKRPENGLFQPESGIRTFFFDETGDTDIATPEAASAGGLGAILKLTQSSPSTDTGRLTMFSKSDVAHSGLDNVAFLSRDLITFVEDAGDGLHGQRNALDSAFAWNTSVDYSDPANQPVRSLEASFAGSLRLAKPPFPKVRSARCGPVRRGT